VWQYRHSRRVRAEVSEGRQCRGAGSRKVEDGRVRGEEVQVQVAMGEGGGERYVVWTAVRRRREASCRRAPGYADAPPLRARQHITLRVYNTRQHNVTRCFTTVVVNVRQYTRNVIAYRCRHDVNPAA